MNTNKTICTKSNIKNKNICFFDSDKQNILGELYNENIKDLKAEYKLTVNFEKTLDKQIVYFINLMFLKYGKIFFIENVTKEQIVKNNKKSVNYFQKSAIQNNPKGQYNLALSYYYGIGIKQSFDMALKYLKKSARQKNSKAQYALATMYLDGISVRKNIMAAIYYFRQASEQKHILATIMLAAMYKFGIGCRLNKQKSKELIDKIKSF